MGLALFAIICALASFYLDKTVKLTIVKMPGRHSVVQAVPLRDQEAQNVPFEDNVARLEVSNRDKITIFTDDLDEFIEKLEEVKADLDAEIVGLNNMLRDITNAPLDQPTVLSDDEGGI